MRDPRTRIRDQAPPTPSLQSQSRPTTILTSTLVAPIITTTTATTQLQGETHSAHLGDQWSNGGHRQETNARVGCVDPCEQEDRGNQRQGSSKNRGSVMRSKSRPGGISAKGKSNYAGEGNVVNKSPGDSRNDGVSGCAEPYPGGVGKAQPVGDQVLVNKSVPHELVAKGPAELDAALEDSAAAARLHEGPPGTESEADRKIKWLTSELENARKEWRREKMYQDHINQRIIPVYQQNEATLKGCIERLMEQLHGTQTELGTVKRQLSDAVNLSEVSRKDLKGTQVLLTKAEQELHGTKRLLSEAMNLSKVRGEELKGAQVFLTKADTISMGDVVGKVATLNDEIFQAAAALGESLVNTVYEDGVDRVLARKRAVKQGKKNATFLLGEALVSKLASESVKAPQHRSNSPLVQIVMESALAKWCHTICEMWRPPGYSGSETTMNELYENIRKTEDQAVAGRWRSLTRAHLHYSTAEWMEDIMCGIRAVMAVAGWEEGPASDSSPDSPNDDLKQFKEHLASICKAVRDVRKAAGEDFTSADLEVCLVEPHTTFDPTCMEDAYGDQRGGRRKGKLARDAPVGRVASTSGLGLRKIVFEKMDGQDGGAWVPKETAHIIAQPKVVLEKTIMEVMPSPPIRGPMERVGDAFGALGTATRMIASLPGAWQGSSCL